MFCRLCGRELQGDTVFCPTCGTKVDSYNAHEINDRNRAAELPEKTNLHHRTRTWVWIALGGTLLVCVLLLCWFIIGKLFPNPAAKEGTGPIEDTVANTEAVQEDMISADSFYGQWISYLSISNEYMMFSISISEDGTVDVYRAVPLSGVFYSSLSGSWEMSAISNNSAAFLFYFANEGKKVNVIAYKFGDSVFFSTEDDSFVDILYDTEYKMEWNFYDWLANHPDQASSWSEADIKDDTNNMSAEELCIYNYFKAIETNDFSKWQEILSPDYLNSDEFSSDQLRASHRARNGEFGQGFTISYEIDDYRVLTGESFDSFVSLVNEEFGIPYGSISEVRVYDIYVVITGTTRQWQKQSNCVVFMQNNHWYFEPLGFLWPYDQVY